MIIDQKVTKFTINLNGLRTQKMYWLLNLPPPYYILEPVPRTEMNRVPCNIRSNKGQVSTHQILALHLLKGLKKSEMIYIMAVALLDMAIRENPLPQRSTNC